MSRGKSSKFSKLIVLAIVGLMVAAIAMNWTGAVDFYRGQTYQPSNEMIKIRESLDLTDRGKFLFNASQPTLNSEEEFNTNCRSLDDENAVLGCYTNYNIYVYNITEKRLDGIRELTTAHELLHAVYARMSVEQRDTLRADLEQVYRENRATLQAEIESYDSDEQLEEIYVRSGTEIKNLPETLERHFAEIFRDQDKIVSFYEGYISVFRQLERELDSLKAEMDSLDQNISSEIGDYEQRVNALNTRIAEFNDCAALAGCFVSQSDFDEQRSQLVTEQNALNSLYQQIDQMIDDYNSKVERYNNNVIENNNLQNIINSHVKVEGI